jgi:hypothetical protein
MDNYGRMYASMERYNMTVELKQYFNFDIDSADQFYRNLKKEEQVKFQGFVNRLNRIANIGRRNGLPARYRGMAKKIKSRTNASQAMMDEQYYALDSTIVRTLYSADVFAQMLSGQGVTTSANSWEVKNYRLLEDSIMPELDKSFRNPPLITLGLDSNYTQGLGSAISYEIPWTEIAQTRGGIYSPDFYYAMVAAERMGRFLDYLGWHGSASALVSADNAGIKGLVNSAGAAANTFSAATLTTFGNVRTALMNAMAALVNVYQPGKLVLITTRGIATQALINMNAYNNVTELELIKRDLMGPGKIAEWWVSDRIYNSATAPTNSQQAMVLCKFGPTLQKNSVVYPLQTKPMLDKKYSEDIKEAILYGNVLTQYNVASWPVATAASLTTTNAGIVQDGRFA